MIKREAIVLLTMAILSIMGLANSIVGDESCDVGNDGCVEWEIKELNEIVKTIESRIDNAWWWQWWQRSNYRILIKNLKDIKNKLQTKRWIERWNEDDLKMKKRWGSPREWMTTKMLGAYQIVKQMVNYNDCSVATRVSRTLLKLIGKHFQANCDTDNMKHRDTNNNVCDWYGSHQNFQECGEHDVPPNFIANEMCCACKEAPDAAKTLRLAFASKIIECYFLEEKDEDENGLIQGAFNIIDEFVEAFGKNADNNINIILNKVFLLHRSATSASGYQTSLDFFDVALNIHSRYLGDDNISYANILLLKATKMLGQATRIPSKREEAIELLNRGLEIFSGDEENFELEAEQIYGLLAPLTTLYGITSIDYLSRLVSIIFGKIKVNVEKEIHDEIERNELNGWNLISLGAKICTKYNEPGKLKKIDYDEATGYLLEALAIADSHPDAPRLAVNSYYGLSICEYVKEGKRNLRKASDYLKRGLILISKMDEADSEFKKVQMSKKETIDRFEELLKLITQEKTVYDL